MATAKSTKAESSEAATEPVEGAPEGATPASDKPQEDITPFGSGSQPAGGWPEPVAKERKRLLDAEQDTLDEQGNPRKSAAIMGTVWLCPVDGSVTPIGNGTCPTCGYELDSEAQQKALDAAGESLSAPGPHVGEAENIAPGEPEEATAKG